MFTVLTVLVAASLALVTPISVEEAQDAPLDAMARASKDLFELGNVCEPISLLVESLPSAAENMGLTGKAITTTVRSRLRAARLYNSQSKPYLYVRVNILSRGTAFSVGVAFDKLLSDPKLNGLKSYATTWQRGMVGQGDADYILSTVSLLTDEFLDAYLRINESACPRGPLDP